MTALSCFQTQRVGALPVLTEFFHRLRLGRIVQAIVPWEGDVPLGDLVEILVANRLLEPKPLYKVGSWATKATLANFYNLTEEKLHDDTIGRALERVADYGDTVQAALTLRSMEEFDLDVRQVHYDMSTIELYVGLWRTTTRASPTLLCPGPPTDTPRAAARTSNKFSLASTSSRMGPCLSVTESRRQYSRNADAPGEPQAPVPSAAQE